MVKSMNASTQRPSLAKNYRDHFRRRFEQACADPGREARHCWQNSTEWTEFMLSKRGGVAFDAACDWAEENIGPGRYAVKSEWRKFDLMVISPAIGPEDDWWRSTPRLTLEHENNDDTHVETWNLACWQSPLKVLVTYHRDKDVLDRKLKIAADVLTSHAAEVGPSGAEFLFMSAERKFGDGPTWSCFEWNASAWRDISDPSPT